MNFIVAVDNEWNIGKNNALLAKIPEDMRYFREKTLGKTVVMGRKTLESFPDKKPLPNRKNIVITKNPNFKCENTEVFNSLDEFLENIEKFDNDIFVIGGGTIYNELMDYCKYAYITKIFKVFDADTKIKSLDENNSWKIIKKSEIKEWNDLKFQFLIYENTNV